MAHSENAPERSMNPYVMMFLVCLPCPKPQLALPRSTPDPFPRELRAPKKGPFRGKLKMILPADAFVQALVCDRLSLSGDIKGCFSIFCNLFWCRVHPTEP